MPRKPRKHELAVRQRVKEPLGVASSLVKDALEDAVAHAGLVAGSMTGDGQDYVRLSRSGPLEAAHRRLDRLGGALLNLVRDARVDFYVHSHNLRRPDLDSEHHIVDAVPTREGAAAAADAAITGKPLAKEVLLAIEAVKFMLRNALLQCGQFVPRRDAIMKGWRVSANDQILGKISGLLSDSSHAVHDAVGFALIKESLRPTL